MSNVHVPPQHAADPAAYVWQQYRPKMAAAAVAFSREVYQGSSLSLREMEGARIRTAQINGCQVCQQWRGAQDTPLYLARVGGDPASGAHARGGNAPDEAFYAAIGEWAASTQFSPRERLAIEYAERLGERPRELDSDSAFWTRMHSAFDDGEIVDLTFSITSWIALGRFTHALALDGVCPMSQAA